jgi:ABC-type transport system involved in cytochrome c biogenesis permease subunit
MKKYLPIIITGVFALWILAGLRPPQDRPGAFALQEFGRLPLVANGRFQPLDSFARNTLLQLRKKSKVDLTPWNRWYQKHTILSATEWMLQTGMKPEIADNIPVFRIDHPELISLLDLPKKEKGKCDGKHYSWNQIKPKLVELRREAQRASAVESAHRTPFDQAVAKLWNMRQVYDQAKGMFGPAATGEGVDEYLKRIESGRTAFQAMNAGRKYDEGLLEWVSAQFDAPVILPGKHADDWQRVSEWAMDSGQVTNYGLTAYAAIAQAYRAGDVKGFNQAVTGYGAALREQFGQQHVKAAREHYFNAIQPFDKAMALYVVAFLLACAFWFNLSEWMRKTASWLIVIAFIVHTTGLLFRMWLEARPPVTNLYSSAVFIGWGAVVLGMVLERLFKDGIGSVVAAVVGFTTLIIAIHLAELGDTMEMMRAVLDTNFWLATHVVVVTLGYASTFVAGFLAMIYIVRGVFTQTLSEATAKGLTRMVYGIVCFATLFSFVGTVLGGIWADQSWGRFWGWDPKENGALLIVLWNATILHARWGGMIKERGLMNMAIFGNIVTAFSWFGVNMLGIGLHSYGFMDAAFKWLMLFNVSQITLILFGLLPLHLWKSSARRGQPERTAA